jgi:hypothetical protein
MRRIDEDLPEKVFLEAEEKFFDHETGHFIAVKKTRMYGKIRDIMVAYVKEGQNIKLLTIHPLKRGQKERRIESGRWRKIDERF